MATTSRISSCLWFEDQAESAARFYTNIFRNSSITAVTRYGVGGVETHHQLPGTAMAVKFELDGHEFTALNAGPAFRLNPAVSMQVECDTQEEIDYFWDMLSEGGDPDAQQAGWLKDRYGISWRIVPAILPELLRDERSPESVRAMRRMLKMTRIDIEQLQDAHDGYVLAMV